MPASPTPIILGNWKMNHGPAETERFFAAFLPAHRPQRERTVVLFPPALSLAAARAAAAARDDIRLGVQNVHWEASGAFTGEISAPMAREAGAAAVLVGHSERRHGFGESDADTARKTAAVRAAGMVAVLCVGETIEERRAGDAAAVVARQLDAALGDLHPEAVERLWIAYEPVWAIGTGVTASPDDAGEMHTEVRARLRAAFGPRADGVPVLYGGSVKPDNAAALLATPGVDGLLVGGASLEPESFLRICRAGA